MAFTLQEDDFDEEALPNEWNLRLGQREATYWIFGVKVSKNGEEADWDFNPHPSFALALHGRTQIEIALQPVY